MSLADGSKMSQSMKIGYVPEKIKSKLTRLSDFNDFWIESRKSLEDIEHIETVHDLHIWTITSGMPVLSAHINLAAGVIHLNRINLT